MKVFLEKQSFQVIDWLGNSLISTPEKTCWNHMKNLLKKKDILLIPKLTKEIKELWTPGADERLCPGGCR
jgi:hypothetical protein